jgi:hypothetical protein
MINTVFDIRHPPPNGFINPDNTDRIVNDDWRKHVACHSISDPYESAEHVDYMALFD